MPSSTADPHPTNEGYPEAFAQHDDDLLPNVRGAVRVLRARGTNYTKSKRVAELLDLEPSPTVHRQVGRWLDRLSNENEVEKWGPGNGSATWQILPVEDDHE